jgi:hypothetical protein
MAKLCGAKARSNSNKPCKKPALLNGRCRFHGGLSTGAKTQDGKYRQKMASWKHGMRSKEVLMEKRYFRDLINTCAFSIYQL